MGMGGGRLVGVEVGAMGCVGEDGEEWNTTYGTCIPYFPMKVIFLILKELVLLEEVFSKLFDEPNMEKLEKSSCQTHP